MPVELVILVFVTIIALCMVNPQHYFLVTFAGLVALAVMTKGKSQFVDGDAADMQLGAVSEADGALRHLPRLHSLAE